ncbi:hypothetical protein V476_21835 [Pseudomonas syringae KCTC 12500]|uniref:hypothetical protein n=1 Tax=Pseudomonas syringae TaxID=317 RepID=UPI000405C909|nr:hypothetical protein [Pseudomonas syringae]KMY03622.1 hypothetical protein V476_21835 [Pseudomonas syringae KCTC 12500]KPY70286.1 Uncharacterized protein ALO45_00550 [Pseudomonas syringae pv. syringae]POR85143.1 hypothetical protein BKM21_14065 [Pseudomonas syringae pv. syringae]
MASPAKNSAALSQLGNLYQYLTALKICLESPAGAIINLERLGDITTSTGYQYEVKHHDDPEHVLIDTHPDFWKTLKNWVVNRKILGPYSKLVLLTSSLVRAESLMGRWNDLSPLARYLELKAKADEVMSNSTKFKTIMPFVKAVYDFDQQYFSADLEEIIGRVVLKHSSEHASQLYDSLIVHNALMAISPKSKSNVIRALLGEIAVKGVTATNSWDLERDEVAHHLVSYRDTLDAGGNIFFADLADIECSDEIYDHRCIKEINLIPYPDQVMRAAQDYYYYSLTIGITAEDDPFILKDFKKSEGGIGEDLRLYKESHILDLAPLSKTPRDLLIVTKKLYVAALRGITVNGIGNSIEAKKFTRGMLHSYVNTSDFRWRILESDIND